MSADPSLTEAQALLPPASPPAPVSVAEPPATSAGTPPKDLGELLVDEGIISWRQLETALNLIRNGPPGRRLGRVLVEERMTSEQRIHETVRKHAANYRLGELLVILDLLTPDQLEECLAAQRQRPGTRIGEIALEKLFIGERPLLRTLRAVATSADRGWSTSIRCAACRRPTCDGSRPCRSIRTARSSPSSRRIRLDRRRARAPRIMHCRSIAVARGSDSQDHRRLRTAARRQTRPARRTET
jgi:hypothetical protein